MKCKLSFTSSLFCLIDNCCQVSGVFFRNVFFIRKHVYENGYSYILRLDFAMCSLLPLCCSFHISSDLHLCILFSALLALQAFLVWASQCRGFGMVCRPQQLQLVGSSQIRDRTHLLSWQVDSSPLSHQGSLAFSSSVVVVVLIAKHSIVCTFHTSSLILLSNCSCRICVCIYINFVYYSEGYNAVTRKSRYNPCNHECYGLVTGGRQTLVNHNNL